MSSRQQRAVRSSIASAQRGDWMRAGREASLVSQEHPVGELLQLVLAHLRGENVGPALFGFAGRHREYQAAGELAITVARRQGDLRRALAIAQERAAVDEEWKRRSDRLLDEVVAVETEAVRGLMARGDPGQALTAVMETLRLAPKREEVRRLGVEAALETGDLRSATQLVSALGDAPANIEVKAMVAEELEQWELALEFARRLPADSPGRCRRIVRVWDAWRLADAPQALREAREADPVLRRHAAAIVAWEAPSLMEHVAGAVPVLEDVVQLPEVAEILVVVRSGVFKADMAARRFHPEIPLTGMELRSLLERLAAVLEKPAPRWCDGEKDAGCMETPEIVNGKSIVALVREVIGLEATLCR